MLTILTIQDIFDWNRYYKNSRQPGEDFYNSSEENKMYASFHYLLKYYFFRENCVVALQKLRAICVAENFLETNAISEWTRAYEWLGTKKLVTFLVDNEPDEKNDALKILSLNMHVELKPFMPLAVFCEIFQIIYWELQLHLPAGERKPADTKEYQYPSLPPGTRVKEWLGKITATG